MEQDVDNDIIIQHLRFFILFNPSCQGNNDNLLRGVIRESINEIKGKLYYTNLFKSSQKTAKEDNRCVCVFTMNETLHVMIVMLHQWSTR